MKLATRSLALAVLAGIGLTVAPLTTPAAAAAEIPLRGTLRSVNPSGTGFPYVGTVTGLGLVQVIYTDYSPETQTAFIRLTIVTRSGDELYTGFPGQSEVPGGSRVSAAITDGTRRFENATGWVSLTNYDADPSVGYLQGTLILNP